MKNNQNLFFSPEEKGRAFSDVLKEVQEYISLSLIHISEPTRH